MEAVLSLAFNYELDHLLEALRRDIRNESQQAVLDYSYADEHRINVRRSIRLLELLNPKRSGDYGHILQSITSSYINENEKLPVIRDGLVNKIV